MSTVSSASTAAASSSRSKVSKQAALLQSGEKFAEHARRAMQGIDLAVAVGTDDILFYRENPSLTLADLPQLGPKFQQAYQEISAQQNFTPHSREDITQW